VLKLDTDLLSERLVTGAAPVKNRSSGGFNDIFDHFHGGRLTRSIGAQQTKAAALLDAEGHVGHRRQGLVVLLKVLDFENWHRDYHKQGIVFDDNGKFISWFLSNFQEYPQSIAIFAL
jgi:hypothetical protein